MSNDNGAASALIAMLASIATEKQKARKKERARVVGKRRRDLNRERILKHH